MNENNLPVRKRYMRLGEGMVSQRVADVHVHVYGYAYRLRLRLHLLLVLLVVLG
jgi:hypothetical protein